MLSTVDNESLGYTFTGNTLEKYVTECVLKVLCNHLSTKYLCDELYFWIILFKIL